MDTTYAVEDINPTLAASYLEKVPEHQRHQSAALVRKYARLMEEGKWLEATPEPLAFDSDGFLVQGQHRLLAVVRSGRTVKFTIARNVSPGVFGVLDSGMTRQPGQMIKVNGFIKAGAVRVIRAITGIGVAGSYAGRDDKATLSEVLASYDEWADVLDALSNRVQQVSKISKINGSALLAVMAIASRTTYADRIDQFLVGLETGADLSATDSRLHLLRRAQRDRMINSNENASVVIKSWNAYVLGQPMGQLRYRANEDIPHVVGYAREAKAA